jgi:hypothetical protein
LHNKKLFIVGLHHHYDLGVSPEPQSGASLLFSASASGAFPKS